MRNKNRGDQWVSEDRIVQLFRKQSYNLEKGKDSIVAITHRHWLGVKYATQELFEYVIEIEELNTYQQIIEIGSMILKCGVRKILFSGFAAGWNTLCSYLKERNADIKIIVFWHGNTTHMYEEYSWIRHVEIIQLVENKQIDQLAFAKASMCPVYKKLGIDVVHLKNYVKKWGAFPEVKEECDLTGLVRIGIYASGEVREKNAYTQIAAASLFHNPIVSLIPYNEKMVQFAKLLNVGLASTSPQMSRGALQIEMAKNTINFYVTLTECAPLIPLESLNNGVICLMGDNNHYFEDHELKEWLVVSQPDNAECIYQKAVDALKNRGKILELYQEWYEVNSRQVEQVLQRL